MSDPRFVAWPAWSRTEHPDQLLRYVQFGTVLRLLGTTEQAGTDAGRAVSGRSGAPVLTRLAELVDRFQARGIAYADEPANSRPGWQVIRGPDEVLVNPKHATCLDLAVTFAGACLDVGIHPMIVVVDPVRPGREAHALVVVWLNQNWTPGPHTAAGYPLVGTVHRHTPTAVVQDLASDIGQPGGFAAIDVAMVAARRPHSSTPVDTALPMVSLPQLLAAGAAVLTGDDWTWQVGIDIGSGYDPVRAETYPFSQVERDPIAAAYLQPDPTAGPLEQIKARRHVVPFHHRDELDVLHDWCHRPFDGIHLAVVHGVGGSGKTHLAAELCDRRSRYHNWYAGFLVGAPTANMLAWLGRTVSPLLVVIDYAESKIEDVLALAKAVTRRPGPVFILLVSRTLGSWLDSDILAALARDSIAFTIAPPIPLADHHPQARGVYRRALTAFRTYLPGSTSAEHDPVPESAGEQWTTLDLIMLAWLAAHSRGPDALPATSNRLRQQLLAHEFRYWDEVATSQYGKDMHLPHDVWADLAALITLLGPQPQRLPALIRTIPDLAGESLGLLRRKFAAVLVKTLPTEPDNPRLALRPDPLGDYILVSQLESSERDGIESMIREADDAELAHACTVVTRAAQGGLHASEKFERIAGRIIQGRPRDSWRPALAVATAQGGPFLPALEHLATQPNTPLPLEYLAESTPIGHSYLRRLARAAAEKITADLDADPTEEVTKAARAHALNNLAVRRADAGDRIGAIEAIDQALVLYHDLVVSSGVTFLPLLAMALSNQAGHRTEAGNRAGALDAINQAVTVYRDLAAANPASFRPALATALNNQAVQRSEMGNSAGALDSIDEAIAISRDLAATDPAAFLPGLAMSLINQSESLTDVGNRAGARAAIDEAVTLYRDLARTDPATFLPSLAAALHNRAANRARAGERAGALEAVDEAVTIRRKLVATDPNAFRSVLADSLSNQSSFGAAAGYRTMALEAIDEAVALYRDLAATNPGAFLPNLARGLHNQSVQRADSGDRAGALLASDEAVTLLRELARENPAAFLRDLAMALNRWATESDHAGARAAAAEANDEAVIICRDLAAADPTVFRPDLASALNNQSSRRASANDQSAALAAIDEAVTIRRELARADPAAFLADLADSIYNQSNRRADIGDRIGAIEAIEEAVMIQRKLASEEPVAFLPELARCLEAQSNRRSDAGDRTGALEASNEAVAHYRHLTINDPVAFLPELAGSLTSQSDRRSAAGDRIGALQAADEAVAIYDLCAKEDSDFLADMARALNAQSLERSAVGNREGAIAAIGAALVIYRNLATIDPTKFGSHLASTLMNQANQLVDVGEHVGSLNAIDEAVAIFRDLAEKNPIRFVRELAMSLNNQSRCRGAAEDRAGALAAIDESVAIYRHLAIESPAAFLPGLAAVLTGQSVQRASAGNRTGAMQASAEAVRVYRELTLVSPTAFLPDLASALGVLLDRLYDQNPDEDVTSRFDDEIRDLQPGARAELLVRRARWNVKRGYIPAAQSDIAVAATFADEEPDRIWAGRARRAIRAQYFDRAGHDEAVAPSVDGSLPEWIITPLPEATLELLRAWNSPRDWETVIARAHSQLSTPTGRAALKTACQLFPEEEDLPELFDLIDLIDANGIDQVLTRLRDQAEHYSMLRAWFDTPTWQASYEFASRHPAMLTDPRTLDVVEQLGTAEALQHLAISVLAQRFTIDDAYDIVFDLDTATTNAINAMDAADVELLSAILVAAPHLAQIAFTGPYLQATVAAAHDRRLAESLIHRAASVATPIQRQTGAGRLRRVAQALPDLADRYDQLANILEAIATQEQQPEQTADGP